MKKRFRAPKAKDGELKLQWGKLPHDEPDVCIAWGDGASKRDGHLMFNALCGARNRFNSATQDCSVIEDLAARGYDLETIRFSIQKRKEN